MRLTLSAHGPRDPADVWDRYVRPARWPEWSPQIRSVDHPGPRLYPGAVGTVHGPLGVRLPYTVHDVDSGARRWSWTAGPFHLVHTVSPTTLVITGPAPLVLLYAPLARWALHRLVS
jgi:hypothetical protein